MPLTAEDIAALVEAGITSGEQLLAVARVLDRHADVRGLSADVSVDGRRTRDRERKRVAREKLRNSIQSTASEVFAPAVGVSADVRGLSAGQSGHSVVVSSAPPSLFLEKTVEKEVSKKKVKGSGDARASRLPDDFTPDESCEAIAREHGFTRAHWQRTIDGFRDYWKAQPGGKGLKADWQATCRNWLRREADHMKGPGNGKATRNSLLESAAVLDSHYEERIREAEARERAERDARQGARNVA